jgi:transposase-like protein
VRNLGSEAGRSRADAEDPYVKKKLKGFGVNTGVYMKYKHAEKYEIIRMVEGSNLSIRKTLEQIGVSRNTFYEWYKQYQEDGYDG